MMKNNNIILESGKEYSLSQLFSGDNKIVIPDLQRDYCWGDKAWDKDKENYTELVSSFIKNLLSSYKDKPNDNLTLGLIYGYENPKYHIQLSDGQQRITTLFLLLGMLTKRTKNGFQKHLISDYELEQDDKEPYLQYAIRESTLYFLSDLVVEFFLNDKKKVEDIEKQDWYFREYDLDSSIQSMINALKTIEHLLDEREDNFCHENFGKFILEKLKMIYYDMGNRTRGEETFVIINTTGEPLTATENLKPILIGNIKDENIRNKASNEWEKREEWFWQNRNKEENTSDNAMNDFFIWYWQIRLLQEKSWKNKKSYSLNTRELFLNKPKIHNENEENPQIERWEESIKPETIHSYFNALVKLIELSENKKPVKPLKTIKNENISLDWFRKADLDVVLPLIAYLEKFKEPKCFYEFVRRIRKNYFDNKWKERNKNFVDWRHIIQIIEVCETEEQVLKYETKNKTDKFLKIANVSLNEWYNKEEKLKGELKIKNKELIEEWEDHEDFMGDLGFLFSIKENPTITELGKYYNNYVSTVDSVRDKKDNNPQLVNLFRLFYLFIGCNNVAHMSRVTWEAEGVLFSVLNRTHLNNEEFKQLIASEYIFQYLTTYLNRKIKEWDLFNLVEEKFSTDRFIKTWLTLKVFNANKENVTIAFYDGNNTGVAVYKDPNKNKLVDDEQFSIENSICGFGVKAGGGGSYIHYTRKDQWLKANIIDTPFDSIEFDKNKRTKEQIADNKKKIEEIIKEIGT